MSSEKLRLIENAIVNNSRYLTGTDTDKLITFMRKEGFLIDEVLDEEGNLAKKETIIRNLRNNLSLSLDYFRIHEIEKSYKYGVTRFVSIVEDDLGSKINDLIKQSKVSSSILENNKSINIPTYEAIENYHVFNFPYAIGTRSDKSDWFSYPILLTIYPKEQIIVISFDSIPYEFHTEKDIYQKLTIKILDWFESTFSMKTCKIDIIEKIKEIVQSKNDNSASFLDVKEFVRDGYDKKGGRLKLVADDNDEMSILDQLKKISESLSTKEDQMKLNKFIEDLSNNLYYVERGLIWNKINDKRTSLIMTARENFVQSELQLLHFYKNNWDRGRVAYALNYIITNKK